MNKNSIHDTVRQLSIARGCLPVPAVMPGRHRCRSDASSVADLLAMASPGWDISPSNWSWDEFGGAGPITRQGLQAIFPNSLFFFVRVSIHRYWKQWIDGQSLRRWRGQWFHVSSIRQPRDSEAPGSQKCPSWAVDVYRLHANWLSEWDVFRIVCRRTSFIDVI